VLPYTLQFSHCLVFIFTSALLHIDKADVKIMTRQRLNYKVHGTVCAPCQS
jgi:hypothetical protein